MTEHEESAVHEDSAERETRVRNYFGGDPPSWLPAAGLAGVGAVLVLSALSFASSVERLGCGFGAFGSLLLLPGVLLLAWGGLLLAKNLRLGRRRHRGFRSAPTDGEMDALLDRGIRSVEQYGLSSLCLEDSQLRADPIRFASPITWPIQGLDGSHALHRAGDDGRTRFGAYGVVLLFLAEKTLGVLRGEYDFVRDRMLSSQTLELRYADITSVSTAEQARPLLLPEGDRVANVREICLGTVGGEVVRLEIDVPELWNLPGVERPPSDEAERAVRAIRRHI